MITVTGGDHNEVRMPHWLQFTAISEHSIVGDSKRHALKAIHSTILCHTKLVCGLY